MSALVRRFGSANRAPLSHDQHDRHQPVPEAPVSGLISVIALSVLSAMGYATAALTQEHYAEWIHGIRRWVVPLLLTGAGGGFHVAALQYGAVGVVQALGTLTLIFALAIAAVRARRRATGAAWHHAWLTVGGLAVLLTITTGGTVPLSVTVGLWLAGATAAVVTALALAAQRVAAPLTRSILLSGAAGIAFGVGAVQTKTFMTEVAVGALSGTSLLTGVAIAGLAGAGQVLSQRSYRGVDLAAPLAMVSVSNPAVAGGIGLMLLGDTIRFGTAGAALAAAAAIVTIRGVIGLANQPATMGAPTATAETVSDGNAADTRTTVTATGDPDRRNPPTLECVGTRG
jgi:hypothetical protein